MLEGVSSRIVQAFNDNLISQVEATGMKKALFSMHPNKFLGLDGISPDFYQKLWGIVGGDLFDLARKFFAEGELKDDIGDTNIALIPKKKNPRNMMNLRPISLCNVSYKIISTVLANRLKLMLSNLISEIQSAFIPGRFITDNIMVSYEVMHYMKHKTQGKTGGMALKLDMSKAYDCVEWRFLRETFKQMGFSVHSMKMMMVCVCSVKYQICHAG